MKKYGYRFLLTVTVIAVLVFLGISSASAILRPLSNMPPRSLPDSGSDILTSAIYMLFAACAGLIGGLALRNLDEDG